jgi:hypothetical protein
MCVCAQAQAAPDPIHDPQGYVRTAVQNELRSQSQHKPQWMYRLRKTNASGTRVSEIIETRDGLVARLLELNGKPLDPTTEQNERRRLEQLKSDPGQLRQKLARQEKDRDRVLKIVRALPDALVFTFAGKSDDGSEMRFSFTPNPQYSPDSLENNLLKAMVGTLTISAPQMRLTALHGTLERDVSIGLGIVGKAYKGGTLDMIQQQVAPSSWEITHLKMAVTARALFRSLDLSVDETLSDFKHTTHEYTGVEGIDLLLNDRDLLLQK